MNAQQETIQAVNRTIRDFAEDPRVPSDETWEFFCECGCFTLVERTLDQYDSDDGIWLPGHEQEEAAAEKV